MYKALISSKLEDSHVFLQCYCGNELIYVYYYKPTSTCAEIISLDYFGDIKDKSLFRHKHWAFTLESLKEFICDLELTLNQSNCEYLLNDSNKYLLIKKTTKEFLTLSLNYIKKSKYYTIWDIVIRNKELELFIKELIKIKNKIEEDHNYATRNY